jgi:Flp pilus assembly protein TadG
MRGQATVEFTLIFVLFMVFIFMIVDGGRAILYYDSVSHLAREGTRYAIVRGSTSKCSPDCPASVANIESFVKSRAIGVSVKKVEVCWWKTTANCVADPHNPSNKAPGSTVQVRVESDFDPVVPFIPQGVLGLSSTTEMIIAQ